MNVLQLLKNGIDNLYFLKTLYMYTMNLYHTQSLFPPLILSRILYHVFQLHILLL